MLRRGGRGECTAEGLQRDSERGRGRERLHAGGIEFGSLELGVCVCARVQGWVYGGDGGGCAYTEEAYLGMVCNCHKTSNCQSVVN